jgi:uncharacterized protein (TIGR03086 family)
MTPADPEDLMGLRLLEKAAGLALASVQPISPPMLTRATPCEGWDLATLLLHLVDSLGVLHTGLHSGRVQPPPDDGWCRTDPVSALRVAAARVLRSSYCLAGADAVVRIGDRSLALDRMAGAGAIEVAVHAWDIAQASGARSPIPARLADELLRICPLVLPESERRPLFADPVDPAPSAGPGDRLVALLGRDVHGPRVRPTP